MSDIYNTIDKSTLQVDCFLKVLQMTIKPLKFNLNNIEMAENKDVIRC